MTCTIPQTIALLVGLSVPGFAMAGIEAVVLTGARRMDVSRLSSNPGDSSTWGADLGASLLYRLPTSSIALGVAYREHYFNPESGKSYFEQMRFRGAALEASLSLYEKGLSPDISISYTPSGSLTGTTTNPVILDTPAPGAIATRGESTWTYGLTGLYTRIGMALNLDKVSNIFLGVDLGHHKARLKTVSVRGSDQSDRFKASANTPASFSSYSVLFGLRVGV